MTGSSCVIAARPRRHPMLPCGAARSQLSWGERLQSADGTGRAGRACSRCAGAGTRCVLAALFSASAAGESYCRARTTHGVLASRDRIASAAALVAAVRSCPPPVLRGRETAERRWHVACSSRAIATCRRRHLMLPCCAAPRQFGLGERLQSAGGARGVLVSPRRRRHPMLQCCAALRQLGWGEKSLTDKADRKVGCYS